MTTQAQQTADELLAHALAAGRTITGSAQAAGVSESTAYRRLREPGFRARVDELRAVLLDAVTGRLTSETLTAGETLSRLLRSPSEATQLRAARAVIELAFKLHDRDRRAGLLGPGAPPGPTTGAPAPEPPVVVAADPEPLPPVTAGPGEPESTRDIRAGEAPAVRPEIEMTVDREPVRNLSKPVTDCHGRVRPKRAGHAPFRPPVENRPTGEVRSSPNPVDRLSAGLTDAIERVGSA